MRVFHKRFNEELLRSERRRTTIMLCIFSIGFIFQVINALFLPTEEAKRLSAIQSTWIFPVIMLLFQFLFLMYITSLLKRKTRDIPAWIQYITIVFETGMLTWIMAKVAKADPTVNVLQTQAVYIYFMFIILSTMRLHFWLSFLTGLLSGISFVFISYSMYDQFSSMDSTKLIIIIICGVCAGLVAKQIRRGINRSLEEADKRNKIENMFGQQISMEIAEQIIENDGRIESKRMNVAVMFIDIRNFTAYASERTPEDVVKYQNAFFSIIIESVTKYNGIVNQFLGDGCMVTFGAPVAIDTPGKVAVRAALHMISELEEAIYSGRLPQTKVGIGIHAGDAVTGNIGTDTRQQYTITGNVVILASRIEQLNKKFGSQVLISEEIARGLDERIKPEFLSIVPLKGVQEMFKIFKIA